ncbi:MAG: enolase 1 [Candidatus Hepatoplasma vulgare]|nr:MAG: enolase 1 [Candidatus Hepatoplasma sp.]
MTAIVKINARQILNSQGRPTIEVEVWTKRKNVGIASVPSGFSVIKKEALELVDHEKNSWMGQSVERAVNNINKIIAPKLIGMNVTSQKSIDKLMNKIDGTKNKIHMGANATLAVSMAVSKAAARDLKMYLHEYIAKLNKTKNIWLPIPQFNILNGGPKNKNKFDFKEILIAPISAKNYYQALEYHHNVHKNLEKILREKKYINDRSGEGAFTPDLTSNEEGLELVTKAINDSNYKLGTDIMLAINVGGRNFYNKRKKIYKFISDGKEFSPSQLIDYYIDLVNKYSIISIQDPLYEDDVKNLQVFYKKLGKKIQIAYDDLFVTNKSLIKKYAPKKIANALIIKPNQIGTITETLEAIKIARHFHYKCIVSHRSAETGDTFISDFAVGINSGQIKIGTIWGTERIAKYNRFIRISEEVSEILSSK